MKERRFFQPAALAQAIRDGRRTQARVVIDPQPAGRGHIGHHGYGMPFIRTKNGPKACPFGQPGDRLWIPETFAIVPRTAYRCSAGVQQTLRPDDDHDAAIYRHGWTRSNGGFRWRPGSHMPRWACRTVVEITAVRVERLQDISARDCWAEGVPSSPDVDPVHEYRDMWESIHGPGSWDRNPWVWGLGFKVVKP